MDPIALLLIGMAIVIGGILFFRLHAFLALIIAALAVAGLTRKENITQFHLDSAGIRIAPFEQSNDSMDLLPGSKQAFIPGRSIILRPDKSGIFKEHGRGTIEHISAVATTEDGLEVEQSYYDLTLKNHDFDLGAQDRVVHETQYASALSASKKNMGERVAGNFGKTCTGIGILIAMAAIIGKCLMDSGGAERIVLGMRNAFGEKRAPLAFIGSGFTLGIPVFFDTVFYLMIPLGKAMRVRTGKNYLLYVLTIVAGGTMAHSLVPPTPGPLFVAGELGVDIGLMMLAGTIVGLFTAGSGYLYALWANKRWDIPLRESAELPQEQLEAMANRDESELPGLLFSIMPILLPVVLMAGGTILDMSLKAAAAPPQWLLDLKPTYTLLGNKNIAMTLAAVFSLVLLARSRKAGKEQIGNAIQSALASGGVIILITAAGGAFGGALRESGISMTIQTMLPETQVGLLPLAFIITMVVRTAQGSATVAMITAVGIISPILASQPLSYNPLWIALAIGCGSKPISWMNDSGFWVISKMSGLTEGEMLKTNTAMGCIMASVGLIVCMVGATILPLA
ncbi:MAG: GntP family gluconate:H+ symporter [Kiritimatiellia bacterium]|jgi:gluconate:H+ symporter, GntP family